MLISNSENCTGNSYPLRKLLDKGVPFIFLHTAQALADFSPAHVVSVCCL